MSFAPLTLATISQVVGVGSAIFGAVSQAQAANYQAAVAERNRVISEENARRAAETSQAEVADWGESARAQMGNMLAELAATGGRIGAGTSALQRRAASNLAARDAQRLREQGNVRIDAFSQQASDFAADAGMARQRGAFSLVGGAINAFDSFVTGSARRNDLKRIR